MRVTVVAMAVLGFTGPAAAQGSEGALAPTAFSWVRGEQAEDCPTARDVSERVGRHLKGDPFVSPASAERFVEGTITREGASYRVHIRVSDARAVTGERDLAVEGDCRSATDSAALAVALMLEPAASSADEPAPASPSPAPPEPPPATPALGPAPARNPEPPLSDVAPRPRKAEHWRARLAIGATGAVGQLPSLAVGPSVLTTLGPPARRGGVELGVSYLPEQAVTVRADAGGTFSATTLTFAGWWSPYRRDEAAVSLSAGPELGRLAAHGFGFAQQNRAETTWIVNLRATLELSASFTPDVEGILRLGLAIPLRRDSFEGIAAGGSNDIFTPSAAIALIGVGLGVAP